MRHHCPARNPNQAVQFPSLPVLAAGVKAWTVAMRFRGVPAPSLKAGALGQIQWATTESARGEASSNIMKPHMNQPFGTSPCLRAIRMSISLE